MDLSYNAVAAKCAEQMAAYQNCVLANQNSDWGTICRPEGKALTQCADNAVPHLAELKMTCADQIAKYRFCLETNGSQSDEAIREQCAESLASLWKCTESAMADIEKRS